MPGESRKMKLSKAQQKIIDGSKERTNIITTIIILLKSLKNVIQNFSKGVKSGGEII